MAQGGVPFALLGPPWNRNLVVALPPPQILLAPPGTYGIAYDLSTHNIQDNLPVGWATQRCMYIHRLFRFVLMNVAASVYAKICSHFRVRGYLHEQYSVWQRITTPVIAWADMMALRTIRPLGIFATVVRRLEMFHVPHPLVLVTTNSIRLGGIYSPTLVSPTPTGLAQGMGGAPPAPWPNGPGDSLPPGVRNLPGSLIADNWRL